jgi:hypothetical protein
MPSPSFLPVTVTLSVPSKTISFKKFIIKPTDSITEVKLFLETKMKETGNPILQFTPDNYFVIQT